MDQFNLWRGGCQRDGNRVNSDDRTRQGRAVVHRAGLGRHRGGRWLALRGTMGPWSLRESTEGTLQVSGGHFPRAKMLLQGFPISHSVRAPLPSPPWVVVLLCYHLLCILHGFFLQLGFLISFPVKLSLSRRCLWFSPTPEVSESELSYLLIGARDVRHECLVVSQGLHKFQVTEQDLECRFSHCVPWNPRVPIMILRDLWGVKGRSAVGLRPPAGVSSCEALLELFYILVNAHLQKNPQF